MTRNNLPSASDSPTDLYSAVEFRIVQERLRQAHHSFNLALGMTAACAFISLVGVGLLLSGEAAEGTATAAVGIASSVRCLQLAKDANNRLDKMASELKT